MRSDVLISPEALAERLEAGDCVVFDCRFDLSNTGAGRAAWREGHVPGAVYAHLDDDLSSPIGPTTGRHPLPEAAAFAHFLAVSGWRPGRLAVVYSRRSLGSTWRSYRFGLPCQMDDEDGRRLSANIVLYFMTR